MQYWGSLCYNYNTGHGRILPVFAVSLKEGVSLFLPQVQNMYRTCPCTCSKTTKIVATEISCVFSEPSKISRFRLTRKMVMGLRDMLISFQEKKSKATNYRQFQSIKCVCKKSILLQQEIKTAKTCIFPQYAEGDIKYSSETLGHRQGSLVDSWAGRGKHRLS